MELRAGYKQTEVGVIPEDWEASTIGSNSDWMSGGTPSRSNFEYWSGTVPWISGSTLKSVEISTSDQFLTAEAVAAGSKMAPVDSTLLLVRGSALHSEIRAGLVVSPVAFNQDVKALVPSATVEAKFLTYFILAYSDQLLKLVSSAGNSAGVLDTELVQNFKFLRPPLPEQRAIATALSDVDALLAKLDALLAKKRDLKEAAMQQLLTGQTRLPGFSGEWQVKRLGDVAHIKTGAKNNDDKVGDGEYPLFVRSQTVERIDTYSYDCEAILVPGEGGIGSIFHYINGKFDCHQRVYKISAFNAETCGKFVFFCMKQLFHVQASRNSVKATVDSLRLPTFLEFEFVAPGLKEQVAIVETLDDMDAELAALEARRDKTRALKQGMMQELLTGRIRLV